MAGPVSCRVGTDIFEPKCEPERAVYRAFQEEARNRKGRSFEEWGEAEVSAVHRAAARRFPSHGLPAPTLEQVRRAEAYARGSIDYGATWIYALVRETRRKRD